MNADGLVDGRDIQWIEVLINPGGASFRELPVSDFSDFSVDGVHDGTDVSLFAEALLLNYAMGTTVREFVNESGRCDEAR